MGTLIFDRAKALRHDGYLIQGMGPTPISHEHVKQALEQEPDIINWAAPREVILCKGPTGKLGLKLNSYQGKRECYTIVTRVKEDCCICGGVLNIYDRIIAVNNESTVRKTGSCVLSMLQTVSSSEIVLEVTYINSIPGSISGTSQEYNSEQLTKSKRCEKSPRIERNSDTSIRGCTGGLPSHHRKCVDQNIELLQLSDKGSAGRKQIKTDLENETTFTGNALARNKIDNKPPSLTGSSNSGQNDSRNIKRGHSQVSGSSSNQSVNSNDLLIKKDGMRRAKENKSLRPHYKSGGTDSPDRAELEPLRAAESLSPVTIGKVDRFNRSPSTHISKDTAVSMQDIMFEEHGLVQSHSSHLSNCHCSTCASGSESRAGYSGTKSGSNVKKTTSPGVSLFIDANEPLPTEYGNFLLKNPHLAVWDGLNTHVIEIDKGTAKEFGFSYKVKIGKNQDTSVEVYTLVKSVDKGGPAKGKLRMGDWIRSVNGTPIQSPEETFKLISTGSTSTTMRLVIQRPVGFSQHPNSTRPDKSETYVQAKPPSPLSNSPSPGLREQDPLIPGIIEPKKELEKTIRHQNIYFTDMSISNNDSGTGSAPFPRTVKFPKARIFVCGSEAEKYVDLLLKESEVALINTKIGYTHLEFSMAANCFGNVVISNSCSDLYEASNQINSYLSNVSQSDLQDSGDLKCKKCGTEADSVESSSALGTIVNVDLFIVPDDRLFHTCCSYLFTKSSIFILTFDGDKMLRAAPQEFSHLQNLSHTVRSIAGEECSILSSGLLESGSEDEVRALFYTSFNTQLQNYNVSGPELINLKSGRADADMSYHSHALQLLLWKTVTDTIQRQHVLQPSLLIVDYLHSVRDKDMILTEEQFMNVIKTRLPDYQLDVHQLVLTYLNTFGEIMLGKATPYFSQGLYSIDNRVILNPKFLLSCLHRPLSAVCEDRQSWSRTICTGYIRKSDLAHLTGFSDNEILCRNILDFWECCGLIFSKPKLTKSSEMEIFMPYFAQLPSNSEIPSGGKKDLELYLQFIGHEASQTFYQVMFVLAVHCDNPESLSVQATNCAVFTHKGFLVTAFHQKIEDRIKFIFRREDKALSVKPCELYTWLYSTCKRYLETSFTLCAACPLRDACHRGSTGVHMVDLRDSKPQYCSNDRIDTLKTIKVWKQKETEYLTVDNGSLPSKQSKQPVTVMDLPWSVFHKVCLKLMVPSDLGRDWKGLAGLMGFNVEDVDLYETAKEPVKQLLCDWGRSKNGTIEKLIALLTELDRQDIISEIHQGLLQSSSSKTDWSPNIDVPSLGLSGVGNITVSERSMSYNGRENEMVSMEVPKGSITVAEKGTTNMGIEDGVGLSASMGVKLNNLDNNNQVDTVTGIGTEMMITPVETPRRREPLRQT